MLLNPIWVTTGIDKAGIDYAEELGKKLATHQFEDNRGNMKDAPLTSSQIRNVFGEVRRIQQRTMKNTPEQPLAQPEITALLLLRPKLAYATARSRKSPNDETGAAILETELTAGINAVRESEAGGTRRFQNFCDLFEAILAYHKKYDGE